MSNPNESGHLEESTTGAVKYSGGKLKYSLIPVIPKEELARVYTVGAEKYSPRNWEKGFPWSHMIDAMERHIEAFKKGEFNDKESGCKHLAAAAFYCFALMEFEHTHPELNDLPGFDNPISSVKYKPGEKIVYAGEYGDPVGTSAPHEVIENEIYGIYNTKKQERIQASDRPV